MHPSPEAVVKLLGWLIGLALVYVFSRNYFATEGYHFDRVPDSGEPRPHLDFSAPVPPRFALSRSRYRAWQWAFTVFVAILYVMLAMVMDSNDGSGASGEWK